MNPSHKQKRTKDDAPQWWIDAHNESLLNGVSIVLISSDKPPEHIPINRYDELIEAMKWAQTNREVDIPSQES